MKVTIEGLPFEMRQGQTIMEAAEAIGLMGSGVKDRPIAARIGGEIFNLAYTPLYEASVSLLRYGDEGGSRVYERTLQFVLIMCVRKLFADARVFVKYSLGDGLYMTIEKEPEFSPEDMLLLKEEMRSVIKRDLKLVRKRMSISDALSFFEKDGQLDKAALLKWRRFSYFDVYRCPEYSEYIDYYYGETAPSTGFVPVFDLHYLTGGLVMMRPDKADPEKAAEYVPSPKMAEVFRRSDSWGRLMTCSTANELNTRVENGSVRELIRVNEALHEKMFAKTADAIIQRGAKAVMIAGPSSSGKTTSANRIATQLRAEGLDPLMISLDNYYCDRQFCPRDEDGELDFEHIEALDIKRFNHDLKLLMAGEEVETPIFDFITQKPKEHGNVMRCGKDQLLIIEGIHGLNPRMLGEDIDMDKVFRVYVSALTTINLDDHNRVRTTDLRLLRRLVRDHETRGASMERTLSMWPSVRRGEAKWIFTYQEQADMILNTILHYEPAIMKRHIYPLLLTVPKESEYYYMARSIVKYLNYFLEADVEDEIPPTSVLREFIGGNTFYI
ncbi:MAG: nucleoside kinase [Clostridiales bacterium]|nr:nucleoside kinase [Clostridiales bacterium]